MLMLNLPVNKSWPPVVTRKRTLTVGKEVLGRNQDGRHQLQVTKIDYVIETSFEKRKDSTRVVKKLLFFRFFVSRKS